MGIQVSAYYAVPPRRTDEVEIDAREALIGFDAEAHGVSEVMVRRQRAGVLVAEFAPLSADVDRADSDAENAAEAITALFRSHFGKGTIKVRQLELRLV